MGNDTIAALDDLLDELKQLLNGVSYLRELTPRTLDYLVSFGERLSVRIMAARLNQLGVPAQHFESWTLGLRTTSAFGKADVLPECYGAIRGAMKKLDDNMCVCHAVAGRMGPRAGWVVALSRIANGWRVLSYLS